MAGKVGSSNTGGSVGAARPREIVCANCGQTALVRVEPVYEGFRKVGETVICTACGFRYEPGAEVPFAEPQESRPRIFSDDDRPVAINIFSEEERRHSCGWCRIFVVNPFTQRCGLTNQPVEATGLCLRFEAKPGDSQ